MAKKEKKNYNVNEAVGDTSGFSEGTKSTSKRKKIILFSSLGGFVLFILLIIFVFSTPTKVEFYFQDGANTAVRYVVNNKTKLLEDGPKDPTRYYYDFGGWYYNADTTKGEGYFNNNDNKSLLEHKFTESKKIVLYARWVAHDYIVTYNCKGNANFNNQVTSNLASRNTNPSSYTVKHTLSTYERNTYADYLRSIDPNKYVNDKNAQNNLTSAIELYVNETQKPTIVLYPLTQAGWTFIGWFDDNDNQIENLDRLDPKNLNLTARWSKD